MIFSFLKRLHNIKKQFQLKKGNLICKNSVKYFELSIPYGNIQGKLIIVWVMNGNTIIHSYKLIYFYISYMKIIV